MSEYIKKEDAISKILTEFVTREENGKVMCACADVKQTCADILDGLTTYPFPDSAENKGDLISRQAVEEMIKAEMPERGMWEIEGDKEKETVCEVCVDLMQKLSDLPSTDNEGEWIEDENFDVDDDGRFVVRCSRCGKYHGYSRTRFCPNCGAKMRGE